MPRSYQVTPAVLGRRRATGALPVRPGSRRGSRESARRQPENQPDGSDVTAQTTDHSDSDGSLGLGEPADTRRLTAVIEPVTIVNVGAVVEMQSPRDTPSEDGRGRLMVSDEPDRLAVTGRLFADTSRGERLNCERLAMGIGLWRCGPSAIWKGYVGPPALPEDPIERERFLEHYRVRHRDIEDAVNQMLGRDPDQHRPPRLSWDTLIELLSKHGIELSEAQLIALPFRCELSPEVQTQLAAASD